MEQSELESGFYLGDWLVEPLAGAFSRGEARYHVEPKLMDVLLCLALKPGETVSREALLADAWPGVVVSEEVLTRAISELRSLLQDTAREKRYIRTLPKRGYALIMPVRPLEVAGADSVSLAQTAQSTSSNMAGEHSATQAQAAISSTKASEPEPVDHSNKTASGTPFPKVVLAGSTKVALGGVNFVSRTLRTLWRFVFFFVMAIGALVTFGITAAILFQGDDGIRVMHEDGTEESLSEALRRLQKASGAEAMPEQSKTLAVLPFANLSGDDQQDYVVDGVAEDIRNALIQIPNLKVVARTSSLVFKDKAIDVREIGRQLGADVLLEGTVRTQGRQVRVTVQLTDAETGHPLWADSFNRDMSDVFMIQEDIAEEVSKNLELQLSADFSEPAPMNPEAYRHYVQGRHLWHQRTERSLNAAEQQFQEAIVIQPDLALAWSGLADTYSLSYQYAHLPLQDSVRKAMDASNRALELGPQLAEAHASKGLVYSISMDIPSARQSFERAVQLKPSYSMARMWLGTTFLEERKLNDAFNQYSRALDNDPLHPSIQTNFLTALKLQGRYNEANQLGNQFFEQSRDERLIQQILDSYFTTGQYDKAFDFLLLHNFSGEDKKNFAAYSVSMALLRLGNLSQAERLIEHQVAVFSDLESVQIDMTRALVQKRYDLVDDIAKRLATISITDIHDKQVACENYNKSNRARSLYWQGLGAYGRSDFELAGRLMEEAKKLGGLCWGDPDIELSLDLYRADIAGRLGQEADKQAILSEVDSSIRDLHSAGWGHVALQLSEVMLHIIKGDAEQARSLVDDLEGDDIQIMVTGAVDPMFQRYLEDPGISEIFDDSNQDYIELQHRTKQRMLAKIGI